MKKLFLWIFTIMLFCMWAIAGASDTPDELILSEECPIGYSIFGQIPRSSFDPLWNGFDSDIARGITHFDNFSGLPEDVCRITWWGFDIYFDNGYQECTEDPMDFEVGFYPDDGSGIPDTLNPIYILLSATPTRTPTGRFYGPLGGLWIELNRYELAVDPCISITEGWIAVQGISYGGDPQDCIFFWINSAQGDSAHWKLSDQGWTQFAADQAFCLGEQYTPIYGACCDVSTGNCQENIEYQDCPQGARFEAEALCEDLDPPCLATIFCEDFTSSLGTFTGYEAGDPAGWQWVYYQGNPAGSAFHNDDEVDCDDWLISPGDYTVAAGDILVWDQVSAWAEYIYYHGVLISSDYINGNDPATGTWTELYRGAAPEDAWETQSVDLSAFAGETVHIAFHYTGYFADEWWVDNVCVYGIAASPCVYLPGDCDHNGTALELGDVIAMIGIYRGSVEPYYVCDCPTHGDTFAAEADPNGNCVALELGDVVLEIGAYRGTAEASGCPDCPGSLRLMPGGKEMPLVMPTLKPNTRINPGSNAE